MKLTSFFNFRKPEGSDPVNVEDFNDNMEKLDKKLHELDENNGDMSHGKVFATIAGERESIASGETIGVIVGKVMRWFKDLKGAAWRDVANNDSTTADGYVADARIVKAHGDEIDENRRRFGNLYFGKTAEGKGGYKTSKDGQVTPFRNPTGNAAVGEVLSGKTFANKDKDALTGTMPNQGAWTGATSGNGNVPIPAGYHNGNGYVSGAGAYNKGVSDADARVNTESASYKSGYTNGSSSGASSYNRSFAIPLSLVVEDTGDDTVTSLSAEGTLYFNPYTNAKSGVFTLAGHGKYWDASNSKWVHTNVRKQINI